MSEAAGDPVRDIGPVLPTDSAQIVTTPALAMPADWGAHRSVCGGSSLSAQCCRSATPEACRLRSASAGLANGSHAKLCGRSRVPKPERRGGCGG
jgi:hypothetical protein